LKFIVLDEAHTYTGILGCHMSNLIRRIYNSIDIIGSNPNNVQFFLASATVGNASEMALQLLR
jgi:DEAD/DEAH box helicase domain-containing protein